jgi:hypothetical protein
MCSAESRRRALNRPARIHDRVSDNPLAPKLPVIGHLHRIAVVVSVCFF